jgi:uncharacterized protein YjbI with pentapeptide repeats
MTENEVENEAAILELENIARSSDSFESSIWIVDENGQRFKLNIMLDNWKLAAFPLAEGTQYPTVHLSTPNESRPFLQRYYPGHGHKPVDSWRGPEPRKLYMFSEAMTELVRGVPGARPEFDTMEIKCKKSPHNKPEQIRVAIAAWAEAFGVEAPSNEALKAAKRSLSKRIGDQRSSVEQLLRSGSAGIKDWNDRPQTQRKVEDLLKIDLSGCDLRGVVFQDLNLTGSNLSGADLSQANLQLGTYKDAVFENVRMHGASMRHCTANGINFQNAQIENSDFYGTNFQNANFDGAKITKSNFSNCNLGGANLGDTILTDCTFNFAEFDNKTSLPAESGECEQLKWVGRGMDPRKVKALDFADTEQAINFRKFFWRLETVVDKERLKKSLKMLKQSRFKLFAELKVDSVTGVVKSQTDPDLVYACRFASDGNFGCCTQNLNVCGGLRGALCKHILLLILGLARAKELDPRLADQWARASVGIMPSLDKAHMTDIFLRYRGAEVGEIDWRPTETMPEDFYAI